MPVAFRTAGDGAVYEEGSATAPLTTVTDPSANILAFDITQITSATNRFTGGIPCPTKVSKQPMEDSDSTVDQSNPIALLRRVRSETGEETFAQWGLGVLGSLQPSEILRKALHGLELRPAAFSRCWLVDLALSRPEDYSARIMQSLQEAERTGRSSSRWRPPEQFAVELGTYLSKLSQPGAQAETFLHHLWRASEGAGLLRQALSAVQEARRPADRQAASAVRRLTAEECEFLQGMPRGYTRIPWRKRDATECPDGPRYKAIGNSMAVPVVRWIFERIDHVRTILSDAVS